MLVIDLSIHKQYEYYKCTLESGLRRTKINLGIKLIKINTCCKIY